MFAGFALAGGLGIAPEEGVAHAQQATGAGTSVTRITVNNCIQSSVDGAVILDGNFTGSLTLALFFQTGNADPGFGGPPETGFQDTGLRTTATFNDSSSANYSFPSFTPFAAAKAYRVQIDASALPAGLNPPSANTKSDGVPPCTYTTTSTSSTITTVPDCPVTTTTTAYKTLTTTATKTLTATATKTLTTTATKTLTTTAFKTLTTTSTATKTLTTTTTATKTVSLVSTVTSTVTLVSTATKTLTLTTTVTTTISPTTTTITTSEPDSTLTTTITTSEPDSTLTTTTLTETTSTIPTTTTTLTTTTVGAALSVGVQPSREGVVHGESGIRVAQVDR